MAPEDVLRRETDVMLRESFEGRLARIETENVFQTEAIKKLESGLEKIGDKFDQSMVDVGGKLDQIIAVQIRCKALQNGEDRARQSMNVRSSQFWVVVSIVVILAAGIFQGLSWLWQKLFT